MSTYLMRLLWVHELKQRKNFRSILGGPVSVQLNVNYWASEMTQCVETPAVPTQGPEFDPWRWRTDSGRSLPPPHMCCGKHLQVFTYTLHTGAHACARIHTHTIINKTTKYVNYLWQKEEVSGQPKRADGPGGHGRQWPLPQRFLVEICIPDHNSFENASL